MKYDNEPWYGRVIALILARHGGKRDVLDRPYEEHFTRVAQRLVDLFPQATADQVQAALLHDAFEPGTVVPLKSLQDSGVSAHAIRIVERISLPKDDTPYLDYMSALCSSGDKAALEVKLADNLDAVDLMHALGTAESMQTLRVQYLPARALLEEALKPFSSR